MLEFFFKSRLHWTQTTYTGSGRPLVILLICFILCYILKFLFCYFVHILLHIKVFILFLYLLPYCATYQCFILLFCIHALLHFKVFILVEKRPSVRLSIRPSFSTFSEPLCMLNHQTCSSRGPEKVLYLFKPLEIQDGRLGLWLAETFSTTSLYLPEMVL
jgi:hypothetical protein